MSAEKTIDISVLPEVEQDLIKALFDKCCERVKPKVVEVRRKVWKPKIGEHYWYLWGDGNISTITWCGSKLDADRYKLGNCFRTEEEAKFVREKKKVEVELERYADEHNSKIIKKRFCIQYNDEDTKQLSCNFWSLKLQGAVMFTSRQLVFDAIEAVGEDRIKKYIFGVESEGEINECNKNN